MKEIQFYYLKLIKSKPKFINKVIFKNSVIIGFFILTAVIFWYPVIFEGKILLTGDLASQYYPWFSVLYDNLRQFNLPLWVAEMGNGYPLLAEGEIGVFYPVNWILIWLFPKESGFQLYFPIHSIIASTGAYMMARSLKITRSIALLVGLSFAYSFFFTARTFQASVFAASGYLPWGGYIIENFFHHKKLRKLLLLSLIIFIQLITGHPQITFISIIFYLIFYLFRLFALKFFLRKKLIYIFFFVLTILLGTGLAAVQLIPTWELSRFTARTINDPGFIFSYSLPKSHFLTYLFPYFFGISPAYTNTGFRQFGGLYWEFALYIGIVSFLSAVIGGFSRKNSRIAGIFLISFFIFAALSVGGYIRGYRFLVKLVHLPFRVSARFILPATLSLTMLSGFGLMKIINIKHYINFRIFKWLYILYCLWLITATFAEIFPGFSLLNKIIQILNHLLKMLVFTQNQNISVYDFSLTRLNIWLPFLFTTITAGIIVLYKKNLLSRFIFLICIYTIFFLDAFYLGKLYQFPVNKSLLELPQIAQAINQDNSRFRTFSISKPNPPDIASTAIQPNLNLIWNISSYNAVTPLGLSFQDEIYSEVLKDLKLTSALNVKYIFAQTPLSDSNLKLIKKDKEVYLYRNLNVLPRAYFVYNYDLEPDKESINWLIRNLDKLTEKSVINGNDDLLKKEIKANGQFQVQNQIYSNTYIKYNIDTSKAGIFMLLDSFYPGWQVWIDHQKTKIYRANVIYRAIFVPAGSHEIEYRYIPASLYQGFAISILFLIAFILIFKISKNLNL